MGPPTVNSSTPAASSASASSLVQNRERLLHLSLTLIGQKVVLEQTDGAIVEGIFHTFTPFNNLPAENKNKFVLKEIRVKRPPTTNNGKSSALKDGAILIVAASKVVYLHAKNLDLDQADRTAGAGNMNGTAGAASSSPSPGDTFATDTQISGSRGGKDRDLVAAGSAWTTAASNGVAGTFRGQPLNAPLQTNSRAAALGGAKASSNSNKGPGGATAAKLSGSIGGWDQFKANEELFNVNASFDENLYTTQLDLDNIDAKKVAEAERIAREIESSVTDNAHLAEERGHKIENDFRDEEDRYSTVLSQDGKQRHDAKGTESNKPSFAKVSKVGPSSASGPRKIMNYAAAAAKADPAKKTAATSGPTGSISSLNDGNEDSKKSAKPAAVTPEPKPKAEVEKSEPPKILESQKSSSAESLSKESDKASSADKEAKSDAKKDTKEEAVKTKLNPQAKEFTFNPQAKSFTPGMGLGSSSGAPAAQQQPTHQVGQDPNMQMYAGGHPMQPAHYMPSGHMGQPGRSPCLFQLFLAMS